MKAFERKIALNKSHLFIHFSLLYMRKFILDLTKFEVLIILGIF